MLVTMEVEVEVAIDDPAVEVAETALVGVLVPVLAEAVPVIAFEVAVDAGVAVEPGWLVAVCTEGGVAVGGIAMVELNNAVMVWLGVGKTNGVDVEWPGKLQPADITSKLPSIA